MSTNTKLTRVADNIRILSAAMVEKAKSGHPGGAMGGADFVTVLYAEFLRYDPDNMAYPYRDRFFLDPGHMSPMLYSVLSLAGFYSTEDLKSLRQWGSVTPGHPEVDVLRGVENTSGPLGQGHAMALGAAIAERFLAARFGEWMAHRTYAYISDGAVEEEISQGVGRIAGHLGLSNLVMYYDANNIQLSTKVDEVDTENVAMKYEAWGWNVLKIDGHNINEIREALVAAQSEMERPTLIIGRTVMGKGAVGPDGASYEDRVSTHGQPLSSAGADFAATVRNLGGDPDDPFAVFEQSREVFAERREALRAGAAEQAGRHGGRTALVFEAYAEPRLNARAGAGFDAAFAWPGGSSLEGFAAAQPEGTVFVAQGALLAERLRRMTAAAVLSMCPQGDIEVNARLKARTTADLVVDTICGQPPSEHDVLI